MGSPTKFADGESQSQITTSKRGGWITFPFMIATMACLTLAGGGWLSNLIVYLIQEFDINGIDAAQIFNIVAGCINFCPFVCAIIADSFLGCYSIIWISSLISLLGIIMILLTSTLDSLRPQPCQSSPTHLCNGPSHLQYSVLYTCLALASLGLGGTRFIIGTMGADQFSKPKERAIYFNWFFFTMYFASVITITVFVYVQDNVSWALGFSLCLVMNVLGLVIFLMGTKYYKHEKPEGSPFTGLARVIIASIRKRKVLIASSVSGEDFYHGDGVVRKIDAPIPSNTFRFFNRGALIREGDIGPDGSITKRWNLCTVQQVEDLKPLIRLIPLWTSSIFLATPIAIQGSLTVLQALTMDRHLGSHFTFPAGSIGLFTLLSTSLFLAIFDRFLWPLWRKLVGKSPKPLQLIGIGHVLNVASMAVSAVVELKRRETGHGGSATVPMSVFWLVPQMVVVGIGEAFHFPGQVALYYQEFPSSLRSLSSAMIALLIGIAFYLGTALIGFVRRVTGWLPNNINDGGKLDYLYWVVVVVGVFNFCYYLVCTWFYKYQPVEERMDDSNSE